MSQSVGQPPYAPTTSSPIPNADCFAAALAAHRKATLATSDHDFATVEKKIDILWAAA